MKNRANVNIVVLGFLLAVFLVSASIAWGQEQAVKSHADLAREARYTIGQARKIALRQCPGEVESENLKKENGTLLYLFVIRDEYEIFVDVRVDAITGRILYDEKEKAIQNIVLTISTCFLLIKKI